MPILDTKNGNLRTSSLFYKIWHTHPLSPEPMISPFTLLLSWVVEYEKLGLGERNVWEKVQDCVNQSSP